MEVLRYGSRGNDVLLMQLALQRNGRYRGALDGVFGPMTLNALRRFQSAEGLAPDGAAGPLTNAALEPWLLGSRRIRIRRGDSFYRLAKRFGTSAEALAAANPKADPLDLKVGSYLTVPYGFELVPKDAPTSGRLTGYVARGLALRYPFVTVGEAGRSALGTPLYTLETGGGSAGVFINASHHANEWITTPLALGFLERLCIEKLRGGSVGGAPAEELFAAARIYMMPLVDPDGADLVTGALPTGSAGYRRAAGIAEDYPAIPFPSGWKANIEGTDLNLNYPADWDEAREVKFAAGYVSPAPRDYVGAEPLSAPEARAVYDYTLAHDFALTLSFHTQGGEIYWRYKGYEPPGGELIGRLMAEASGYALADVPDASSNAGYRDWFILRYRRPGFTVEAGRGENPLPLSELPKLEEANYPLLAQAILGVEKNKEA